MVTSMRSLSSEKCTCSPDKFGDYEGTIVSHEVMSKVSVTIDVDLVPAVIGWVAVW